MIEILFRGKRTDNGEWVYGFYVKSQEYYTQDVSNAILSADGNHYGFGEYTFETYNEIDVSTLGQYTGLTDKNGTKIFEGDFITANHNIEQYNVYWKDYRFYIEDVWGNLIKPTQEAINHFECEVIGNIYDNPELLEGK